MMSPQLTPSENHNKRPIPNNKLIIGEKFIHNLNDIKNNMKKQVNLKHQFTLKDFQRDMLSNNKKNDKDEGSINSGHGYMA